MSTRMQNPCRAAGCQIGMDLRSDRGPVNLCLSRASLAGRHVVDVAHLGYHPAQGYAMCMPPWLWWWWCPNNAGATWGAPGATVGAGEVTEAACARGRAPNNIAPATALAPSAPPARRRAEESEIDICLLLCHV